MPLARTLKWSSHAEQAAGKVIFGYPSVARIRPTISPAVSYQNDGAQMDCPVTNSDHCVIPSISVARECLNNVVRRGQMELFRDPSGEQRRMPSIQGG